MVLFQSGFRRRICHHRPNLGFWCRGGRLCRRLALNRAVPLQNVKPHVAEVGLVAGTEHFRNINRHQVETYPNLVTLRVDESLYFANAAFLQDMVYDRIACDQPIRHVVLMCSAVNEIDMSALESLEAINHRLRDLGIKLHLSEVKVRDGSPEMQSFSE